MGSISGKDTKPEILVRKYLFSEGLRFRKNDKRYPGKPDIVLPKYKTVIFVHGCFWHGHNCPAAKIPETRKDFWKEKIKGNIERDKNNISEVENLGWRVLIIWQCTLKNRKIRIKTLETLKNKILTLSYAQLAQASACA